MNVFFGVSAAEGIGIGTAFVIPEQAKRIIPQSKISEKEIEKEWERFITSRDKVSVHIAKQLESVNSQKKVNKAQQEIFETYSLMLTDPVFVADVKKDLENLLFNIEYVLNAKAEEYAERLRSSGNEYLAERGQDICDIFGRVQNELLGIHPFDIEQIPDGAVIVAQSMNPSDTIILSKRKIAGLALTEGGISSHVAILARSFGIPAVFALPKITKDVTSGEQIIVDGTGAEVILEPDEASLKEYQKIIKEDKEYQKKLSLFRDKVAVTKDGERIEILANIGSPEEAKLAVKEGADGIGLFRTEFLFMREGKSAPETTARTITEDEQFEAYKMVLETMGNKPVTIRTLDAGGDKLINTIDIPSISEKNPLMGLRAIRLSLKYPQVLKTQLRALYRASIYGNLKIMLPLITSQNQVQEARIIAEEACAELEAEGYKIKKDTPIGIMVETAAAAITADCLANVSDFFSIGTNDLTQYTIGVDRENSMVEPLYNEFHLAVLRLIQNTIDSANKAKIAVSVCGEMASRKDSVMVLVGMGIRNLSMSAKQISGVKELLSTITIKELEAISHKSLNNL